MKVKLNPMDLIFISLEIVLVFIYFHQPRLYELKHG